MLPIKKLLRYIQYFQNSLNLDFTVTHMALCLLCTEYIFVTDPW
jgi:hypothetical protein